MATAFCAVCMGLASCSGAPGVAAGTPIGQPTGSPTLHAGAGSIQIGYDQNGSTITLHPGETVTAVLPITTWTFQGSSNAQVLVQVGTAVVSPAPFDKNTCPYGGCGTITAVFRAVAPGTAQVTATRASCGEAMGCTGADAYYQFTVVVTMPS